jgi:hypothetical protein
LRVLNDMRPLCWPAYKRLLQHSTRPILVGPWRSEVGFEVLYWIPFLQSLGIDPSRLIPISRGGAAIWYGTPAGVELYDLREPKAVRIENMLQHAKTGLLKQTRVTPFDRAVLKDAAKAVGISRYHVLHPAWMYQTLAPFWQGRTGLEWAWPRLTERVTKDGQPFRTLKNLRPAVLPETVKLPDNFVAARFYLRATFPHSDATIQCTRECLKLIAANQPVVLLNPGVHADEHMDVPVKDIPNVYRLTDLVTTTPRDNLAIQSAVLARAVGFAGTYGGLAQFALRLGKPSVSFYWDWQGTALAHKHLSEALSLQTGVPFLTVRLTDIALLKAVVPEIAFQMATSSGQRQHTAPKEQPIEPPHDDASVRPNTSKL